MAKNFMNTTAKTTTAKTTAAKTTAAKTPKAKKPRAAGGENVTINHAMTIEPVIDRASAGDDDLNALLAELGVDEVIESVAPAAAAAETDLSVLEEVVGRAEATEIVMASATPDVDDGSAPTGTASDVEVAEAPAETAAAPKKERAPRKHYSDKVERLKDRMGASLSEYAVLTTADALVDDTELAAVMERTLDIIRAMNSKEKNRASGFIEFLSGKKAKLNNVLERVLGVLEKDGYLQTGNEGNVFQNLIARPYSPASARAMGGNTVSMFADLKVILPLEGYKGRYVANPDSLLLAKAKSMLAAAPAATEVADEVEEGADAE